MPNYRIDSYDTPILKTLRGGKPMPLHELAQIVKLMFSMNLSTQRTGLYSTASNAAQPRYLDLDVKAFIHVSLHQHNAKSTLS